MPNVKITDLAADGTVSGVELFPVSDAGVPKKVTITQVVNYAIDAIEAITTHAGTPDGGDSIMILENDNTLKPCVIEKIQQYMADTMWGKTAETVVDAADIIPLKDGATTEKIVTVAILATYIQTAIEAAILDISDKTNQATPAAANKFLIVDGTTAKYITWTQLSTAVYAAYNAYVTALAAVTVTADADVFYCIQSGTEKKVTLSQILDHLGTTYKTKWIPADATQTSATAGMDTEEKEYGTNDLTHHVLLGDGLLADESVEVNAVLDEDWDLGTVKSKVFWAPGNAAANVGELVAFNIAAGAFSNDDALDTALGTSVEMADAVLADDNLHITPASAAMTIGGSPALGSMLHFKLTRNYDYNNLGAGVAMDVDARIFGILIQYKTSGTSIVAW